MVLAGARARTVGSGRPGSGALARTDGSGGGGRESIHINRISNTQHRQNLKKGPECQKGGTEVSKWLQNGDPAKPNESKKKGPAAEGVALTIRKTL